MKRPKYTRPDNFACTLNGIEWQVKFVRRCEFRDGSYGSCNWGRKLIRIAYDQDDTGLIDTIIHELRHGLSPADYVNEDWIDPTSTEIAAALIRAGIGRKPSEGKS